MSARRQRTRRRLLASGLLLPAAAVASDAEPTVRLGLAPYLSARAMVEIYRPLRAHLEQQLGRAVVLYTAADFGALVENLREGAYDVALLPAHFAWLAAHEWGHPLLARAPFQTEVQLIGLAGSRLFDGERDPSELVARLRGQKIATLDPLSLTSLTLRRWLAAVGAQPGDIEVVHVRSVGSAMLALRRREVAAMAATASQLRERPEEAEGLQRLATMRLVPTPVFVARLGLPRELTIAVRQALLAFAPATGGDGAVVARSRYVEAHPRDLDSVREFALQARALLEARARTR